MFFFADRLIKWSLVYLRIFCEIFGFKRAERFLRHIVDDEPDASDEKPVV